MVDLGAPPWLTLFLALGNFIPGVFCLFFLFFLNVKRCGAGRRIMKRIMAKALVASHVQSSFLYRDKIDAIGCLDYLTVVRHLNPMLLAGIFP